MRTMIWVCVLSLLSMPRVSAQEVKPTPVPFGKDGYVTRDQLAKLTYGPVVKDLALAVHLASTSAPVGQPLWAYFVVKNLHEKVQGLDMRFDFVTGQTHGFVNASSFTVKPLTDGAKIGAILHSQTWECGSDLVDVAGKGYYVAALDLNAWGKLRPGAYEISWRYSRDHLSNTARFNVRAGHEAPLAEGRYRHWHVWELQSNQTRELLQPMQEVQRENWDPVAMRSWWRGDLSAALASGVGERYVTNLEALPASDELLSVSADWELGDKMDHVTLRLSAKNPNIRVGFYKFHLYLLADFRGGRGDGGMTSRAWSGRRIITTPYSMDIHLPSQWRTRTKDDKAVGAFQAAFLLTSTPLREPRRGRETQEMREAETWKARQDNPPRIWQGLLKTSFHEIPSR